MTLFQNVRKGLLPARLTADEVYDLTAAGVLAEGEKFELIDGEIVPRAAAKANGHEQMKRKLVEALIMTRPRSAGVYVESSLTLDGRTLVEPDIAVWSAGGDSREVRGPDLLLVIEIADSSIAYDLRVKAPLYARFGIRDYWVVDAVRRTIRVHRAPQDEVYADVEEYEAHDSVAALLLEGVEIRLDTLD